MLLIAVIAVRRAYRPSYVSGRSPPGVGSVSGRTSRSTFGAMLIGSEIRSVESSNDPR
jgi:hypothetical protein